MLACKPESVSPPKRGGETTALCGARFAPAAEPVPKRAMEALVNSLRDIGPGLTLLHFAGSLPFSFSDIYDSHSMIERWCKRFPV